MVLAHSLRDNGARAKLVVLVTLDGLKVSTIDELKTIYDEVIPITHIVNHSPANLYLMDRPDLISTFSKIELWKQTQYKQIVYIDADCVAVRAPDELLTLDTSFAAVPDIGWPDCFNTGVMVLRPNMKDYYALLALAQRGISFDGADQGLLNMHFRSWDRLSFTYNCTPSGHYQYVPAFRHFQSTISVVHFIGREKPWNLARQTFPQEGPYNELLGRWWETYDRHYRPQAAFIQTHTPTGSEIQDTYSGRIVRPRDAVTFAHAPMPQPHIPRPSVSVPAIVQLITHQPGAFESPEGIQQPLQEVYPAEIEQRTETQFIPTHTLAISEGTTIEREAISPSVYPPGQEAIARTQDIALSAVPQYVCGEEHVATYRYSQPSEPTAPKEPRVIPPPGQPSSIQPSHTEPSATTDPGQARHMPAAAEEPIHPQSIPERTSSPPQMSWDASRVPPPLDSKPEAFSLPSRTYSMSQDTGLFKPPASYPDAPKDMYYQVPEMKPAPEKLARIFPWEMYAPKPTRVFLGEDEDSSMLPSDHAQLLAADKEKTDDYSKGSFSEIDRSPQNPWQSYMRANAWDEVPEIEKYMRSIQRPRRAKVQVLSGSGATPGSSSGRRDSVRVTDFPTEVERPSLPVTPAPIRRSSVWAAAGEHDDDDENSSELPPAAGVPKQEEWNPMERLEELQQRQSSLFLEQPERLLSGGAPTGDTATSREIPRRQMLGDGPPSGSPTGNKSRDTGPVFKEPSFGPSRAPDRDKLESVDMPPEAPLSEE
ncbi:hypothetical protein AJ80_08453 [Polytolypa hystricis UAMH7299]|uniref:glycogenin glucosyltransferase n=1 Tax=Polytolypa hystricis (strain UAMH7299) TaxID=1447883 RepID=A0A2B7WZS3_POLH7|nr:hypothetical protein AJ80_08453 [Polytolypa hystricis UAMH7299]